VEFWIDVLNPAGAIVGPGPIRTATNWDYTRRLDAAGEFSFSMPASDSKSTYLVNNGFVHCYTMMAGVATDLGFGVIHLIEESVEQPTMITVSGPDVMWELSKRTVGRLKIREQIWTYLTDPTKGTLHWIRWGDGPPPSPTPTWDGTYPLVHDGNLATHELVRIESRSVTFPEKARYLYIGYDARYDSIRFNFHSFNVPVGPAAGDLLILQYYSSTISGWENIVGAVDGTFVTGTWEQNGDVSFTPPADWERYDEAVGGAGNWFWIRIKCAQNGADDPRAVEANIHEISVHADFPTLTGPDMLMNYAPGWTIDPDPASTTTPKYIEYQGESMLTALIMLCEQGGQTGGAAVRDHFRLGANREIEWLGTAKTASGLRMVSVNDPAAASGAPELVLINALTEKKDSSAVVTRIYPWTEDGLSIGGSDRAAPAGFTAGSVVDGLNTYYYVQHTAGVAAFTQIDLWETFPANAQQTETLSTDVTYAANAAFDAAIEYLRTHGVLAKFYAPDIVQFPVIVDPGDTIECVYYEYTDGVPTVAIDTYLAATPLWILETTFRVDQSGISTIGLVVATIDRLPKTDADVVVDLVMERDRIAGNMGNVSVTMGGGGASTPPSAGPDIRVSGYQVSRAGNGVLLFSGAGALLAEYAADAAGIVAAFAASAVGDGVEIPNGTLTLVATLAVPAGRALRGRGWASILAGHDITLGVGATAQNFKVYQSVNTADDIVGISGPGAAGECYVNDAFVELIQAGAGKACGLLGTGTGKLRWGGITLVRVNGGTGSRWASAAEDGSTVEGNHGSVKAWIGA
jgi:hypothetical protein